MDIYDKAQQLAPEEPREKVVQAIDLIKEQNPGKSDEEVLAIGQELQTQATQTTTSAPTMESVPSTQETTTTETTRSSVSSPVQDYLMQKYGDRFSPEARQRIVEQNQQESSKWTSKIPAAMAVIGETMAGRNAAQGAANIMQMQEDERKGRLDRFDTDRKQAIDEIGIEDTITTSMNRREIESRKKDPQSAESQLARTLASEMMPGGDYENMSAAELESMIPNMKGLMDARLRERELEERLQRSRLEHDAKLKKMEDDSKKTKSLSSSQSQAATFADRIEQSEKAFDELTREGYDRSDITAGLGAMLPNVVKSSEAQRQAQAERNFINAVLRRESGAAIAPSEFDSAEEQYFPRAGDSDETLAQKKQNREIVLNGLRREVDPAGESTNESTSYEYPKDLRKDDKVVTVQNKEQETEAKQEGWM